MRIFLLLVLPVLGGCNSCRSDDKGDKKLDESKMVGAADIRTYAKIANIEPKQLRCSTIGDSKAFTCRTSFTETEVQTLAVAWGLKPDDPKDATLQRGRKFGCEGFQEFQPDSGWKAWASTSKPEKLAGVEYARLYFRADTDKVCIEMEKIPPPPSASSSP